MCWLQSDDSSRLKTVIIIIIIVIIYIYRSYVRLLHFCCNPSCPEGTFKDFQISRHPLRGEEEGAELNSSAVTGAGICCCCCCFPLFCSFKWRLDQNSLTEDAQKSNDSALNFTVKHFFLSFNTKMFAWNVKTNQNFALLEFCGRFTLRANPVGPLQTEGGARFCGLKDKSRDWSRNVRTLLDAKLLFQLLIFHPVDSLQPLAVFHRRPLELLKHPSANALSHFYFFWGFFCPLFSLKRCWEAQSSQNAQRERKRFKLSTCFCGLVGKKKKKYVCISDKKLVLKRCLNLLPRIPSIDLCGVILEITHVKLRHVALK